MRGLLRGSFSRFLGGDCFDLLFLGGLVLWRENRRSFLFRSDSSVHAGIFAGIFRFFEDSPIVTTKETPEIFAFQDGGGDYT